MKPRGQTVLRARALRGRMSLPEVLMWSCLRGGRLGGLRFRRQHPAGPFILDFYCEAARLAVEIDGEGHGLGDRPEHDVRRDAWLSARGLRVLRLPAQVVLKDMDAALGAILGAAAGAERRSSPLGGSPAAGRDGG